jgi:uncharacterized repeat protein (TIGR03803 family)
VTSEGGSTSCGYPGGCGTIWKLVPSGSGYTYTILHNFSGGVSNYPDGSLSMDASGALYGTTVFGGNATCDSSLGCGTVFKIMSDGSGYTILYSFEGVDGNDGAEPEAGVTLLNGNLYGTTASGGKSTCPAEGNNAIGCGTIFKLTSNASGYSETILHNFDPAAGDMARIPSGLLANASGTLYGTTSYGDSCSNSDFPYGCGAIFSLTGSSFAIVHSFAGPPNDGAFPFSATPAGGLLEPPVMPSGATASSGTGAGLAVDATGTIWGATFSGGSGSCAGGGCGVVYSVGSGSLPRQRR